MFVSVEILIVIFAFKKTFNDSTHFSMRTESSNYYYYYYMALSHKDWELPNAQIWLAEMNIDYGLDFPN